MGSRPTSFKRGGGGFLNGVDAVFAGYRWTDDIPSKDGPKPFKAGKKSDGSDRFHSLYCEASFQVDGADDPVSQHLFAGGFDDYEVSEDGMTLTSPDGGPCSIGGDTAAGKFFTSLCENGFPDELFSDDEDSVNFEPAIGTRMRLVQKVDEATTKKLGKRVDPKTKKSYNRTDLVVDNVLGLPDGDAVAAPVTAKKGKATKAAAPSISDLAGAALVEMLGRAGGDLNIKKLATLVLTTPSLKGNPKREDVRKFLSDAANITALAASGVIAAFDKKTGAITAADAGGDGEGDDA